MKHSVSGVDVAKRVFQLCTIDLEMGGILGQLVKGSAFLEQFANWAHCLVRMEARFGTQRWVHELIQLGPICAQVCEAGFGALPHVYQSFARLLWCFAAQCARGGCLHSVVSPSPNHHGPCCQPLMRIVCSLATRHDGSFSSSNSGYFCAIFEW